MNKKILAFLALLPLVTFNSFLYSDDEDGFYDDNVETNWNGQYRFENLRKGDYTLFVYADSTNALNINYDYPIFKHVKIDANNSTFTLTDFVIND